MGQGGAEWGWVGLGRAGEGVYIKYSNASKLYSTSPNKARDGAG